MPGLEGGGGRRPTRGPDGHVRPQAVLGKSWVVTAAAGPGQCCVEGLKPPLSMGLPQGGVKAEPWSRDRAWALDIGLLIPSLQ